MKTPKPIPTEADMRTRLIIGLVLVTFCAAFFSPAMAQQQKDPMMKKAPMMNQKNAMEKETLPPAVMDAFKKAYPDASITGTWPEKRGEMTYYDIKTMQGQKPMTMVYDKNGTLVETKEPIEKTALPADVTNAVQKAYPKCTMERAEKIMRGQSVEYGVMLDQNGESYSLVYSPEGKMINTQKMMKPEMKKKMEKPTGY